MATVSDILKKIDDTLATSTAIVFRLDEDARSETDAITSRHRVTVTTHASTAAFSTTLRQGTYRAQWRIGADWSNVRLAVPSGSGTYDFNAIAIIEDDDSTLRNVFDDWADLQSVTVVPTSMIVILREDDDDPPNRDVLFVRSTHANVLAATPDGINVAEDATDARFLRQGVDPDNL